MPPLLPLPCETHTSRRFRLAHAGDAEYGIFSELIATVFRQAYGARVMVSYPTLIGVCGSDGRLQAVLGTRGASEEQLFLERYMELPAQQAVAEKTGIYYPRHEIAEAGNLASLPACRR